MNNVTKIVEKYSDLILNAERDIWEMPEPGYFEYKTNAYMIKAFEDLGYTLTKAEDITGFYTTIDTGKAGPTLLILAELDCVLCDSHPECDKETGYVHACGHHAQCATLLGIAAALKEKEVLEGLSGKIKLCCVPAEEGIQISKRKELINKGVISFTSGKAEFISRRYFEDVDLAFMVHLGTNAKDGIRFGVVEGHNGVIRKRTTFLGKAAHAGANPHNGINALNAASTAITTINSLRETFKEEDKIRIHSILTKGGSVVNTVPEEVIMESYVRGSSVKALKEANQKVNRVISSVAAAFGANAKIEDMSGSEPMHDSQELIDVIAQVVEELHGKGALKRGGFSSSSTDMGDISVMFPAVHAYAYGAIGTSHGNDYYVANPKMACVDNATFQVCLVRELLKNNAEKAKKVIANYTPQFASVDEYVKHKKSINKDKKTVIYNDDGTITLDF
ncbi:MAG: amidohydrolase [Clostridia bacterium]|nr:amidohydrolase [Clostridia bacterium]